MSHVRVATVQRFYEDNRQGLFTYALSLTGNRAAAEDAVQTAILRLLRRPWLPRALRPFAYRCVRNAAIDDWRRQQPRAEESIFAADTPDFSLAEHLSALLAQLSTDEREVIILKVYDDLTFRDIASVKRCSLNTVASQYRRGMEKLRALYQEAPA
jgi:RNA polymerase sigma-70 factor (ECF subfamily)